MTATDDSASGTAERRRQVLERFARKLDKYLPRSGPLRRWKLAEIELALLDDMHELARDIMESRIGVDPERCPEKPRCPECGRARGGGGRPRAAPPAAPLGDDEAGLPPVVILWRCRDYFETNRRRIRYDEFRRSGLPLAHEGQVPHGGSYRTWKAAKKSWFLDHAEEMPALRTQALSEDGRWDDYFDKLREGEVEIPTRSRMKPIPVIGSERTSMAPAA